MLRALSVAAATAFLCAAASAAEIKIATYNTESDSDTEPDVVAEDMEKIRGVDIWALQEVESAAAAKKYLAAAKEAGAGRWRYVLSESGGSDLMAILYRTDMFRQIETSEFHAIRSTPDGTEFGKANWGLRAGFFLKLHHKDSDTTFVVGTTHMKCCDGKDTRAHQAGLLAGWIKDAGVPVVFLGDTNIPIKPGDKAADVDYSDAFTAFTQDAGMTWLEPSNPIKTQCSRRFNSMLDQIYYSPSLSAETPKAKIEFTDASYCRNEGSGGADHRPIVGTFKIE